MDLRRVTRVIGARWHVVLIGALVGLLGAILFLNLSDQSVEAVYEATAPMRFDPAEGETIPDLADDVQEARDFAVIAAAELLRQDPTSRITLNLAEARLDFISQASTPEEAIDKAIALRQSYLDVDPELGGGVDDALAELEAEAVSLDAQIAALQPELTEAELNLIEQQTQLDSIITGIRQRLIGLVIAEAAATTAEVRGPIQTEMSLLQLELATREQERAALGAVPQLEQSATDTLLLQTLEARQALLNAEYQRLYLRRLGVAGLGSAEPVSVDDFASDPIAPLMVATVATLGGALIAAVSLLVISRTRRTVWLPEDINVPVLGQVPWREYDKEAVDAWYVSTEGGPRKTAVQALRSAVQAQTPGGSTIALSAHNTSAEDLHALAADLAMSMASAGDSVLMIDANLQSSVALGDFRVGGVSLADILRLETDAPEFAASVEVAVERAHMVRHNLAVIPSGPPPESAADALAGRQWRSLIAAAERRYDTTIIVVDDFGTPSSQAAMQRLRSGILVTTAGATTEGEVNGLIADSERLRISIIGAVFLSRRGRLHRLTSRREDEQDPPSKEPDAQAPSPMTRLHNYGVPDERRSSLVPHTPLGDLASSMSQSDSPVEQAGDLGAQLLLALNSVSRPRAYELIADYMITRAEDMVTASYGYGDLGEDLIQAVADNGFLSLRPISGHKTVGSWLTSEIESETESNLGPEVVTELERLLSGGQADVGFDRWLDKEFFARHLGRHQGQPVVWHLVSETHAISILVPARRMTADRFQSILGEVVGKNVDELERKRKAALTKPDHELAAEYEQLIWEVRTFEMSLNAVLRSGTDSSGREGWEPDWSIGTRANLAPFQRQGLLPFDVLTDEDFSALSATAS